MRTFAAAMAVLILLGVGWWWLSSSDPAPQPPSTPAAAPTRSSSPLTVKPADEPAPPATPTKTRSAAPVAPKADVPAAPAVAAVPTTGTLHISADVADASVFIDRKFIGTAPVTASDVAPGPHRLNVSVAGYDAVVQDLDVTPGPRDIAITFKEVRLAASVAVTHKHAMGSCAGVLKATPQGLTYETANAGDAFAVSMNDIETFEVDYLNKNLKVKIRKGKTYNFTDPDGNADRLFVFHRDVDKARRTAARGGGV
jgi:hypothetical protein